MASHHCTGSPLASSLPVQVSVISQPATLISDDLSTPTADHTTSLEAGARLPVELLLQIAWELPDCVRCDGRTPSPTRPDPRHLFALATTCKGFWHCLQPLLLEAHIVRETMCIDDPDPKDPELWWYGRQKMSALAWSIGKGHTLDAKLAIAAARSMGLLQKYISTTTKHRGVLPNLSWLSWDMRWTDPEDANMDPLSLAIVRDNYEIVELLTEGMPAWQLTREWNCGQLLHYWYLKIRTTPLILAIFMGRPRIAALLLQRFSEVDQSTLKWNEPSGLGFASFLGDVEMVRLMLNGEVNTEDGTTSPWVARMRSQLSDPRAYDMGAPAPSWSLPTYECYYLYDLDIEPPMILASVGTNYGSWKTDGNHVFTILQDRGPPGLLTKPYNHLRRTGMKRAWDGRDNHVILDCACYSGRAADSQGLKVAESA